MWMSWKKNVFSYIVWFAYTLFTGMMLISLTSQAAGKAEMGILGAAAVLVVLGIAVFLLHSFGPKYCYDCSERQGVRNVAEAAIVVVLLAVGLVFRVNGLENAGQLGAYYELAEVTSGQSIPQIAHGAVYFYIQALHTVLYFLGNKFIAGIWFQIILQYGAALIFYCVLRKLCGHIVALVSLAFIMCSPYMISMALILSPELFYLFLFTAVLAWISAGQAGKLRMPMFLVTGILTAFLCYLDIAGGLLLALSLAVIFSGRGERFSMGRKVGSAALCLAGTAGGFASCLYVDAWLSGKTISSVFTAWLTLYQPGGFRLPVETGAAGSLTESLLLFGLMGIGIFSFWCDKKKDYIQIWVLGAGIVMAAFCFGVFTEEMPGNVYLYLIFTVLAGIGMEECFRKRPAAAENQEVETVEKPKAETAEIQPAETKINYIENPLPLPKKHTKRVLDYDVRAEKRVDDFDVEVSDDDDFDI